MRRVLVWALLGILALSPLAAVEPDEPSVLIGVPGQGFEAAWLGELWAPSGKMRVFVRLFDTKGALSGSIDSLDERVRNLEIHSALAFGKTLQFELSRPRAIFHGQMSADGAEIIGRWMQDGQESVLVLRRLVGHPGKR